MIFSNLGNFCNHRRAGFRVAKHTSNVIHEKNCDEFNEGTSPAYLIIDGSEDRGGHHQVVMLFQHLDQNLKRKVTYYKIFDAGVDGSAKSLSKQVYRQFEQDKILDSIKERLAGVVSDGANVMYGHKVKMETFLSYGHTALVLFLGWIYC